MEKNNIIFVCTGNTCRSVIAEHLFRKMLSEEFKKNPGAARALENIRVASAGIAPIPGMNTVPGTLKVLSEEGLDASGHRARRLTREEAENARLVLVMEERQKEEILKSTGPGGANVRHIDSFTPGEPEDIPDPFGHSMEFYNDSRRKLRRALEGLLESLKNGEV